MIPASFDYVRPQSLEDALASLGEHGDDARVLAGGHSLLPVMKARLADPGVLVDIAGIEGLSGISETEGGFQIGAMTTHAEIESSALVQERCRSLAEAAGSIGDVQVRNRGTIGGSLAHADPAADYPAVILAAGAEITVAGAGGERVIGADDFFTGTYETALHAGEILTSVRIPAPAARGASAYLKAAQQASGFAVCGVAAGLALDADGAVESIRVGVTGVAATAYRATSVEEALTGSAPSAESIRKAAAGAGEGVDALDDFYAGADFRRHLAGVYAARAIGKAWIRASGK
ncbi:MAG: xanthine dehydrogenase family protein subunit M [Nitrospinae bacterium]|nr:xanthine dehydrogenase family protein subunit M [Nitrospinota bacterium]